MSEHEPPDPALDMSSGADQNPIRPEFPTPEFPTPESQDAECQTPEDMAVITAELVELVGPAASPLPPLWPAFATAGAAIGAFLIASTLALVCAALVTEGTDVFRGGEAFRQWMESFSASGLGLAILLLPGQFAFGLVTVVAGLFSREPFLPRLGLGRGNWSPWCWPLFLMGTPVVAVATSLLLNSVLPHPSEHLEQLDKMVEHHVQSSVFTLLCVISLVPGVVEELLFRGFIQRRLLKRLPVIASISITSVFFAAAHLDPMHALGVAPLGLWLGLIAWRADTIWPAILGHIGNNAFAVLAIGIAGQNPEEMAPLLGAITSLTILSFLGCLVVLVQPVQPRGGSLRQEGLGGSG